MSEYEGYETDWVANTNECYGFGYTEEQALAAMAVHHSSADEPVTVELIEHVGSATVGPGGARVDNFVRGKTVRVPPDDFNDLRDAAIDADVASSHALAVADVLEEADGDDG